mgnify:CR=1 FL=1
MSRFILGILLGVLVSGLVFRGMLRWAMAGNKFMLIAILVAVIIGLLLSVRARNTSKERS